MTRPEIIEQKPVNIVQLKEEMESIKKRDEELNSIAQKTDEYLNQFVSISPKKAEEMEKKLRSLGISRLKDEFIIKIMDIMPTTVEELKTVLQGYVVSISQEDMKKVVEVVKEFAPGKK